MRTLIETLAEWIVGVRVEDIPARVTRTAKQQLRSVLGSIYPGARTEAGQLCHRAALRLCTSGAATALPTGEKVAPYAAVLCNAALSMAQDFDDYLFLGHTGHSAVIASLAVAEAEDASIEDMLAAQVVANEVAGRLGAYVTIGPQNGQLWAHIHLAGAVAAAARLTGLTAEQTADALAIAFYQPQFTLFAGFMASEAKALTAAQPAAAGLYAVGLAADGLRGARDILEHPRGFASKFAFVPVAEALGGLGKSWVTDSVSCKIYPGCAYIDGPVDAALSATGGERLRPEDVESIDIDATALTAAMEAVAEESAPADSLAPITINFSARRSVAIALLAGQLTPRELTDSWLTENGASVRTLADRTRVRATMQHTTSMLEGLGQAVPLGGLLQAIGVERLWKARHQIRAAYVGAVARGGGGSRVRIPTLSGIAELARFLRDTRATPEPFDMANTHFTQLEFRFSADVTIRLRGGRILRGEQIIPFGAAGRDRDDTEALMKQKLATEAAAYGAAACAEQIESVLAAPAADTPARALAHAATAPTDS